MEHGVGLAGTTRGDETRSAAETRVVTVVAVTVQVVHIETHLADALVLVGQNGVGFAGEAVVVVRSVAARAAGVASRAHISIQVKTVVTSTSTSIQAGIIQTRDTAVALGI